MVSKGDRRRQRILGYKVCVQIRERKRRQLRPNIHANNAGPFIVEMKKARLSASWQMAKSSLSYPLFGKQLHDDK